MVCELSLNKAVTNHPSTPPQKKARLLKTLSTQPKDLREYSFVKLSKMGQWRQNTLSHVIKKQDTSRISISPTSYPTSLHEYPLIQRFFQIGQTSLVYNVDNKSQVV